MLYIVGDITYELFKEFSEQLDGFLLADGLIEIVLTSDGGDADVAIAFAEAIRKFPLEIHIHAVGAVSSAAVMILASGDHRTMSEHSTVMVHEEEIEVSGSVSEVEKQVAEFRKKEHQWNKMLEYRTKCSLEKWGELHKATTYLDAQRCLVLGLIDEVV